MDQPAPHPSVESGQEEKSEIPVEPGSDTAEIIKRLHDRSALMDAALSKKASRLSEGAGFALQVRLGQSEHREAERGDARWAHPEPTAKDLSEAVIYRLGITDLFVEKAQYHLEKRAEVYKYLGFCMYLVAVAFLGWGAKVAVGRMSTHPALVGGSSQVWTELLHQFILAFSGYGFIVLTAVALARGARACLDQRERLLIKRHSLRQGRLYLHLTGGNVNIEEMERAFNWNHEQHNAFTHMPTDSKAPWGSVLEEVVKITPELIKTGANVAKEAAERSESRDGGKQKKG